MFKIRTKYRILAGNMSNMNIEEPLVAYGILGSSLDSNSELIRVARGGVRTDMLWDFLSAIKSSKSEFEEFLPYSLKTFSRKKVLDEAMGERVLMIIKAFRKGEEVFGDVAVFKKWLIKFNPILGDEPKNFLGTSTGCQLVINELGRIEHGVMS